MQNVFIGNYVGRRKIIPTIHLQRATEDIRCSESALGRVDIGFVSRGIVSTFIVRSSWILKEINDAIKRYRR